MTGFTRSPAQVDTSTGEKFIDVSVTATDDLAGVKTGSVHFTSPSGTNAIGYSVWPDSGGTLRASMRLPAYSEQGVWGNLTISVTDNAGNTRYYDTAELSAAGYPTSFEQVGPGDPTPPAVTGFTRSPAQVDTSTGEKFIDVSVTATDDLAGVKTGSVHFTSPSGTNAIGYSVWPDSGGTLRASMRLPAYSEQGVWGNLTISVTDNAGNTRYYDTAELSAAGYPTSFEQVGPGDPTPPAVTGFTRSPAQVDTSTGEKFIDVSVTATDDLAGVKTGSVHFTSPSGTNAIGYSVWPDSGGTLRASMRLPAYSEQGVWGNLTISVTDNAGNTRYYDTAELSAAGYPTSFENRDTTAPETTIDSGPSAQTNDVSPSFGFSSEAGATFECKLDGPGAATGSYASCGSAKNYTSLADGSYTFSVRATDTAGNTDASPASRTFTVDTAAPQTTITSGPAGLTTSASPSFGFSSEAGATFECKLDGPGATTGSYSSCSSPKSHASLADGSYTFSVRATDTAGNTDASPASRTFTVDTAAPQTTITSGPAGLTTSASPSFGFSSEAGATFECKLDGPGATTGSYSRCSSPKSHASLADGSYTFSVRATDTAGNTDASPASRTFTVDTAAPQTTITSGPAGLTNDPTPTFVFSANETGSSFECRVDSASFAACNSPETTAVLSDGGHTFEVRATDGAGNPEPIPASHSFTVDTVAPQTVIDSGPNGTTTDSTPTFAFSASEAGSSFECRVDDANFAACDSPKTTVALADGSHTFDVRAADAAGNTDATEARRSFTVETSAPQTAIDSGPTGATNDATPTFGFSSSESGSSFECRVDTASFAGCDSPTTTASLADGSHSFDVRATDRAGNTDPTSATRSFTVDTGAPDTSIVSGPFATIATTTVQFGFSSEAAATFECRMDAGAWTTCSSPKSYSALPDGAHVFSVRATDRAGNTDPSPPTRGFTVDTTLPNGGGGPANTNPGPATTPPVDTPTNGGLTSGATVLRLTMSIRRAKLAAVLAKGLRVTSTCSARCDVKVQVRLDRKTAKKLKLKTLVGQRVGRATSSAPNRLTIKFNAMVRKALKRLHRVTLKILLTGRDAKGNATTPIKRTLTIKR